MAKLEPKKPLISIVTPSLNQGEFLEDAIKSILKQTFKNYEHIVTDGVSSDSTLKILKKYKHIRWVSEKDKSYWDAITKAVRMSKGKYITICMASDGYINKRWLEKCAKILESDPEVSMVWGIPRWMEDGKLTDVCYAHFRKKGAPNKSDWLPYWLMTGEALPNGDFVIRKSVFEKCNEYGPKMQKGYELYGLNFKFNQLGYMPYNIPEIAEFGREHPGQIGRSWTQAGWLPKSREKYFNNIKDYKKQLLSGKKKHVFRDSNGRVINKEADLSKVNELNSFLLKSRNMLYLLIERGPTKIKRKLFGRV